MKSQWIVEERIEEIIKQTRHSSLTKALHSVAKKLTSITMFYIVTSNKSFAVYKKALIKEGSADNAGASNDVVRTSICPTPCPELKGD